eukprot:NODE_15442_length_1050_cov_1.644637.p1 GENE.NODE_15442_length_1050_cov_1.644637~~NODE_15442_length_1050_cov_1.644637.p1  ORF type:complete len:231 (-),score=51.49 NODE_15442_length_1050_cov_1.644637:229-921(-)
MDEVPDTSSEFSLGSFCMVDAEDAISGYDFYSPQDDSDEAFSIATEESSWFIAEESHTEVGEELGASAPTNSAVVHAALTHLATDFVRECEGFAGEVDAAELATIYRGFPGVSGAFRLARLAVVPRAPGTERSQGLPVFLKVAVVNGGDSVWPVGAALRCVAGDAFGLQILPVGGLPAGAPAILTLDLMLESGTADDEAKRHHGVRTVWVLTDANGEPFGPLMMLEVFWY